jgi:hypothetical protein
MNVVWDVAPSRSARAPYLGYIEFFTPVGIRFPKETQAKYDRRFPGLRLKAAGLSRNWKYLYEYDIGPEGLKLARVLFGNMGDSCWEKAARNPSAQEAPAPASNSSQESTSAPTEPSSGTKKPNEDADSAGVSALAQRPDVSPVSFKSDPDGADITVDGKYVGSTPSATRLTAGDHEIEIAKPGFKAWKRKMAVTTGGQVTVDAILEKEIPQ